MSRLSASLSVVHIECASLRVECKSGGRGLGAEGRVKYRSALHSVSIQALEDSIRSAFERSAPVVETARRGGFHSVCTPLDLACASGGRFHSTHEGDSIRAASQRGQSGTVHQKSLIPSIMFAGRRAPVRHRQFAHHRLPTGAVHHHVPKAVNRSRPSPQP